MKIQKQVKRLTFPDFFLALAYCMLHARRYTTYGDKIVASFLTPVWRTCKKAECDKCGDCRDTKERAKNTMYFLHDIFFTGQKFPSKEELQGLSQHFDVESIPSIHARLKPESIPLAEKIFEQNKTEIIFAAEESIRQYMEHRENDKNEFGVCRSTGFGLTFQVPVL